MKATTNWIAGMTEKQITAYFRKIRLGWWLQRQRQLTPAIIESAEAFKLRLDGWAADRTTHAVAPTFHGGQI